MKISIITVSYNAVSTIEKTILSVLNQTYVDLEYIVIDADSTDGTVDIICRYTDKIDKIVIEKDEGIYDAMNKGIEAASGEVIGFLNADDVYASSKILEAVKKKMLQENTDSLYGDLVYVKNDKIIRIWRSNAFNVNLFKYGWMPPHPTFFVKSSVYKEYGGFNTYLKISADYELMLRLLYVKRISSSYLPTIIVRMNIGGESNKSIKNRLKANEEDVLAWKLNDMKMPFYTRYLKPLLKLKQFIYLLSK